jgi:hypothetical protein
MKKYLVEYEYEVGRKVHIDREEISATSAEDAKKKIKNAYKFSGVDVYPIFSVVLEDE